MNDDEHACMYVCVYQSHANISLLTYVYNMHVCMNVCMRDYHMHSLLTCSERACTRPLQLFPKSNPQIRCRMRTLDCQPPSSASIKTCSPKLPIVLTTRNTIQVKTLHAQSEKNQNELETLHSVNFIESKIAVAFVTSLADALNNMRALSYSAMAGSVFMKNALRIP